MGGEGTGKVQINVFRNESSPGEKPARNSESVVMQEAGRIGRKNRGPDSGGKKNNLQSIGDLL